MTAFLSLVPTHPRATVTSSERKLQLSASAAVQVLMLRRGAGLGMAALEVRKAAKSRRGGAREQRRQGRLHAWQPLCFCMSSCWLEGQPDETNM